MHISLLLLLGSLALESAAAQTPAPRAPRPIPPPRRAPAVAPVPAPLPPLAPMALLDQMDWMDQWPHFEYELQLPHFEYELLLPHEPLFPALPELAIQLPPEPLLPQAPELDFQLPGVPMLAPLPGWPEHELFDWGVEGRSRGTLSRMQPEQGTPEDSLFRAAREALNRGEYSRASSLFQSVVQRFPRARVAPAAIYWQAFALYRSGSTDELRAALEALKSQQERYPEAAADPDAATLRTRLYAALAARGDAQAATALRAANAAGASCDREEIEVRAEALNALAQIDAPEARPTLKRVLARRDECSATLRRRAVYILGRSGTEEATADLIEVAKNDPDPSVRSDAIMLIARSSSPTAVKTLEQLFNESNDEKTRQAALSALRAKGGPEAKRVLRAYIEKGDLSDRVRGEAILQLANSAMGNSETWSVGGQSVARRGEPDEDVAAFLRGLYPKTESRSVKGAILSGVARLGGTANEQWLLAIVKNRDEDTSLRREALSRIKTSSLSMAELGKLFDALSERELRYAVVNQLASRDDPAAVDKLIEIARSGTDPQVRRQAIAALARKNDPRTTKLLLELVEKP